MTEEFEEGGWREGPPLCRIPGIGTTGWVVAVSRLAPFAVIELGDVVAFEDGSATEAQIESCGETTNGERGNRAEEFRKAGGAHSYQILVNLRAKIAGILEKHGITVLPEEEWRKPAPWLRSGEGALIGVGGQAIRVLDAFFLESL